MALCVYQLWNLFAGSASIIGVIVAAIIVVLTVYLLVRPYKEATKLTSQVKVK